jgi:four helix bundle protein
MREGRLTDEFRARTKKFAALIIRFYVQLPNGRDEVEVCAKQMLRSGTSVAAHAREASRARSEAEFISKLGERSRRRMRLNCGLNFCERNAALITRSRHRLNKRPTS